jgi:hypothetical protein
MGVVAKARHLALQRTVALKMILAGGHGGAGGLARFRVEAEAVARLQHPNIVQVFEAESGETQAGATSTSPRRRNGPDAEFVLTSGTQGEVLLRPDGKSIVRGTGDEKVKVRRRCRCFSSVQECRRTSTVEVHRNRSEQEKLE